MIRSLQLTDVAPLLLFLGKPPVNEARPRDRLGSRGIELLSAASLFRDCLISGDKQHSLAYFQNGFIHGLVCLRRRRRSGVWSIDHLLLTPGYESCCFDLLEKLGLAGDKLKAERVFLRLDSSSPTVDMAKQAGFNHYLTEYIYYLEESPRTEKQEPPIALRAKCNADDHGLFRLYCAATPLQVRTSEGMTLEEWCQSRDEDAFKELVCEGKGQISAWVRIRVGRRAGMFDIVTELGADELGQLVNCSLASLEGRRPIYCLAPEFQQRLRQLLEERGFQQVGAYSCLSKQLAVRVREPQLVPLRA
jgi:hypothetical protein